jgi:hypothetical protein
LGSHLQPYSQRTKDAVMAVVRDRDGIDRRIVELRSELHELLSVRLTDVQIAEKHGLSHATISYWINGR